LHALLTYIAAHPHAALAIVFLVAFLESVALIGTVIPAAIVMFAAGALIGSGTLDLWTTLGLATMGAILGDGLSYELGRIFSRQIKTWRIFKRYADAFNRAENFIQRHGGKSILFARFLGPLRASVPLVAGIACLPRIRFYLVNIGSAMVWAPVHILPGVLFGASMRIAEAVTARLALLLLIVTALLWFVVWLVRVSARHILPAIKSLRDRALLWAAKRHSWPARLLRFFFDPEKPESEVLLVLALLLLGSGWLFFAILEDVAGQDPLVHVDVAIFNFLQGIRTTTVDHIMVAITALGGVGVLLPLVVVVLIWLLAQRCWRTAGYWLAAAGFYQVVGQLLKYLLARPRPMDLYSGRVVEQFSFPSGHATSSMVIYAFLAFLLSRGQPPLWRNTVTVIATIAITLIGFSRVYLGAHWFSDVAAGFSLGLTWVALLAMVYTHHQVNENLQPRKLAIVVIAALCLLDPWYLKNHFSGDLALYTPKAATQVMSVEQWTNEGWKQVPLQRIEISGDVEEPLPLQWADSAADIARHLSGTGWQPAPEWSAQSALLWLTSDASLKDLPVLPKFSRGRRSKLAFAYFDPGQPMTRIVLRLWRSDIAVHDPVSGNAAPVWYGGLYREEFRRPWHLATLGVTTPLALTPLTFGRWFRDVRWVIRTYSQAGLEQPVFLILPPSTAAPDLPHPQASKQ
jgi:membrane protein DedA with SNARE-associated domain/membrane-associated phospholipid phosphatase